MRARDKPADVVVLGAGLAGMTAAHQLRDLDFVVLEAEERVGGRTLSVPIDGGWYNVGAQFVWDSRTLDLCRELGLAVASARGAEAGIWVGDRLVRAPDPYRLLVKMPIGIRGRVDFARTILRLRRLAGRMPDLDRERIDGMSLAELVGPVSPMTADILNTVTENGVGLPMSEASAWMGLGYAIHLFGGDVNDTLKAVVGGTQRIALGVQESLDPERLLLGALVDSVVPDGDGVAIRYRRRGGLEELRARTCIVALTAPAVLDVVHGLSPEKRAALGRMLPYSHGIAVAWVVETDGRLPWDGLLAVPTIGNPTFQLFSNTSFFYRPPGTGSGTAAFVTLAIGGQADAGLWDMDDAAIRAAQLAQLKRMFPQAAPQLERASTYVRRWDALPRFRPGWVRDQAVLRAPLGRVHFAGDYTAQPGTPGAVGSGFHAAQAVRELLTSS